MQGGGLTGQEVGQQMQGFDLVTAVTLNQADRRSQASSLQN